MKLKIYAEESYTTTITKTAMEIDTDNYPELEGMTEDEISEYIDKNVWDMKPTDELYSSLGEEALDKDMNYDHIGGEETIFYVESI
jgi:hypothetical protein